MTSPMPRDRRGWLTYEDDTVIVAGRSHKLAEITLSVLANLGLRFEIDSDRSPVRTNYERWFADIGSRDEVYRAVAQSCDECPECSECPIGDWRELFGLMYQTYMICDQCLDLFDDWLDEEAVRL